MRKLSLAVAITILFGLLQPVTLSADNDNNLSISTVEDYLNFIDTVNNGDDFSGKTVTLENDIELISPIAPSKTFGGEFDGGGYTLSGLNIIFSNDNKAAIFGTLNEGAYVHDLTVSGSVSCDAASVLAITNNGTVENVKSIVTVSGITKASGICETNNGLIKNSVSAGSVSVAASGKGGGICFSNTGSVVRCENKADLTSAITETDGNPDYFSGIVYQNSGLISGCANYSEVMAKNDAAGIVSTNTGEISACINSGDITASGERAGGICGIDNAGSIAGCSNFGVITVTTYRSGGIVGRSTGGSIENCSNYGAVNGHQYIGGIAGDTRGTASIAGCGNYGDVTAQVYNNTSSNYTGGIIGNLYGTVTDCFNVSKTVSAKWNCGALAGKASDNNNITNSYSVGTLKLIGTGTAHESCYLLPDYNDGKNRAATLDELESLLADSSVTEILLDDDINGDVTVHSNVTVDGQGHSIGNVTSDTGVTLKNLFVNGQITASGSLTLGGLISIKGDDTAGVTSSGDVILDGVIDFDSILIPLIKADGEVSGAELLFAEDDGYYFNRELKAVKTVSVVVKKDNNQGLSRDLSAYITGSNCYFFMPYSADLTHITYTMVTTVGDEVTEADSTIDLSDNKTASVDFMGMTLTARAMTSNLPVLYLDIDEQYGSIYAMNNSKDHSDMCYGDMRLEIPGELAASKGWETVYQSAEKDETKNGTVEIRGRGNSSWSQALRNNGPRPYQVKMEGKLDIMGMGKAKTYTLLKASQMHTNNKTMLNMGVDMGLQYTPQAEFVDVYMNGEYIGLYTLAEKVQINKERVNISDLEDEIDGANGDISAIDITGGYLVEIDNTPDTIQFMAQGNRLTIKSPENLGATADDENYTYIRDLMTDLFDAVYGEGYLTKGENAGKHFTEVLDMDSTTRYFLEQELTSNLDNGLGSTFFYKDKDSIDSKIYMGIVWDNDRCAGSDNRTGWWLPNLIGYNEQDGFFRALCKHKEFISYVLAYYNDNVNDNNIKTIFKDYAEIADSNGAYVDAAAKMSRIRWNYTYPFDPAKLGNFIRTRAAWVDENIDTIKDFATKGSYIEVTSDPIEEPNYNPVDQPEDDHIVAGFRYGNGDAATDLDISLGDKENGYKATVGAEKDNALLFASVDGAKTKTVEWSGDSYSDGDGTYTPAVVSASKKNLWGVPYVDILISTVNYDKLYLSAKLGATKKGPASYKLQYSLDGSTYTDIDGAAAKLTTGKTMQQLFDGVKLPKAVCGKESVHIRITAAENLAVNGLALSDNPSGGEFAFNDIFIRDISGKNVDAEYDMDSDNITVFVKNNTDSSISADIYTAVYNSEGALVRVFKATRDIAPDGDYTEDISYDLQSDEKVRVLCWEKDTMATFD